MTLLECLQGGGAHQHDPALLQLHERHTHVRGLGHRVHSLLQHLAGYARASLLRNSVCPRPGTRSQTGEQAANDMAWSVSWLSEVDRDTDEIVEMNRPYAAWRRQRLLATPFVAATLPADL